jgi:hypothetical protein
MMIGDYAVYYHEEYDIGYRLSVHACFLDIGHRDYRAALVNGSLVRIMSPMITARGNRVVYRVKFGEIECWPLSKRLLPLRCYKKLIKKEIILP